jgi:hypothetical protein
MGFCLIVRKIDPEILSNFVRKRYIAPSSRSALPRLNLSSIDRIASHGILDLSCTISSNGSSHSLCARPLSFSMNDRPEVADSRPAPKETDTPQENPVS